MKKACICFLVMLALSGCAAPRETPRATEPVHTVQMANPWSGHSTLMEAEAAAGFSLSMPEQIGSMEADSFRVLEGRLLEVGYCDEEYTVTVRKQLGEGRDISGVYETFEKETVYEAAGSWIIGKTSEDRSLDLIDSGGYSWSLYAPEGYPEDCRGKFLDAVLGLEQPWIREVNEAFNAEVREGGGAARASELSCFVSCTWAAPEEIDLAAFLRYCPLREQILDEDSEEARAVIAAMGDNPFLVTPVWRCPKEAVSNLLEKYTGITVDDLHSRGGVLYLEEYDAFYNFTSDWGPGSFSCTGGERSEEWITLRGTMEDGEARILTIREEEGAYYLTSCLREEQ